MVHDPLVALETLISLGFERVLTSGCDSSALEGLSLIKRLAEQVSECCAPLVTVAAPWHCLQAAALWDPSFLGGTSDKECLALICVPKSTWAGPRSLPWQRLVGLFLQTGGGCWGLVSTAGVMSPHKLQSECLTVPLRNVQ